MHSTTPSAASEPAPALTHRAPLHAPAATPDSRPRPGRPGGCAPEVLAMLKGVIAELGLSDSAAAARLGIAASTLSRWKREQPEVGVTLLQAREECRAVQLQRVMESAQTPRGWRAAAWLLERLFPEDYAPSAAQRERFQRLAQQKTEEEEARAQREEVEQQARRDIEAFFAARRGKAQPEEVRVSSESDCRNCRNSEVEGAEEADQPGGDERRGGVDEAEGGRSWSFEGNGIPRQEPGNEGGDGSSTKDTKAKKGNEVSRTA